MSNNHPEATVSNPPVYHEKLGYYAIVLIMFLSIFAVATAAYSIISGVSLALIVSIVAGYITWRASHRKDLSIVALLMALVLPVGNLVLNGYVWVGLLLTIGVMTAIAFVVISTGNDVRIAEYDDVSHRQQEQAALHE